MAALAATSSAVPSLQSTLIRGRLEAARREAAQAQAYADQLGVQLDQQQKVVDQSRQRVRTLEKTSSPTSLGNSSTPTLAASEARQNEPTYIDTLAGIFQAAKPILSADLSRGQRNLVTTTLLDATRTLWSASTPSAQAIERYDMQAAATPTLKVGRVLNASA